MIAALLLATSVEVTRLHAIFDRNWETRLKESPLFATSVGRHEYDDRMPSVTMADLERRLQERFGTSVDLRYRQGKGAIQIHFYNDDDLERVLELIGAKLD